MLNPLRFPIPGVGGSGGSGGAATKDAPARPKIPFVRATTRHLEPAFDSGSVALTTSTQALGPYDVPAHGFIRSLVLYVEGSGGALGGATPDADFPWNVIQSVELTDTNGFPIVFPISGYQLYLANLFGGYRGFNDPTQQPGYASGSADLNPSYVLRLPVEITPWDGFGALSNQNQSAPFRVRVTLNATSNLYSGGAPTDPSIRVRGYLEAYSPVAAADMLGQAQEQAPPGHGATQFWSVNTASVASGQQQIRHPRVGNLIRNLVYVFRDTSGDRSATVEPDSFTLTWDSRQVTVNLPNEVHRAELYEAFGLSTIPTGVLVLPFTDDQDGQAGYESRHMWLPTVQSTRLEMDASFGAAGTMEILTNDVAVTQLGR